MDDAKLAELMFSFPLPWEAEPGSQETPPARRSAKVFAADSSPVCTMYGAQSHGLAELIATAVNRYNPGDVVTLPSKAAPPVPNLLMGWRTGAMTPLQEKFIRTKGECPKRECQLAEGKAPNLTDMFGIGHRHFLFCKRCNTLWVLHSQEAPEVDNPADAADFPACPASPPQVPSSR